MRQYSKDMDYNEAVLLTQELVRIPSHKDVEDRESKVAEFIYAYCKEKGLEVEYQVVEGKRRNVIARLRGNGTGKTLMLSGHIDTVPLMIWYMMTPTPVILLTGICWEEAATT